MSLKKLVKMTLLAASCSALIAGCGSTNSASDTGSSTGGGASQKPKIALVTINQQALFFNQLNAGAKKEAEKLGADLVIYDPNNNPAAQNNAIEDYVQQGVKAIIVDAIDVNGIVPALEKAATAHIPVVAVDAIVNSPAVNVQVGVDNKAAGAQIGDFYAKYVTENMKGSATVGIVGALNSFIQLERQKGFTEAISKVPGVKVVQVVDGANVQEKAQAAAENLLTANPDLQTIYATGEPALIGAIAAVKSQHKENQVAVFGWDLSQQAISAIDAGWVKAVVQQDPETEGKVAVQAAMDLVQGKTIEKQKNIPVTIVTQSNVDQFRSLFK